MNIGNSVIAEESKMNIGNSVIAEAPVVEDSLNLKQYIEGMANFIKNCTTPMTVSIQGDWGSGKTSMFNLICNKINDKEITACCNPEEFKDIAIPVIAVNTWQFAVAGYKDNLTMVLVAIIYKKVCDALEKKGVTIENNENMKKGWSAITNALTVFAGVKGGEEGANAAAEIFRAVNLILNTKKKTKKGEEDAVNESSPKTISVPEMDNINYVQNLRKSMGEAISLLCKELGKDRIIIFIDDLDRLEPKNAVELLEGMKNFIDCKDCVFVLAIDSNVVFQGVKEKYGEEMGERLGNKFFEKIIQVPFSLPMVSYDLKTYIEKLRPNDTELIGDYNFVLKKLTDKNPRVVKRLFSMLYLYEEFEKSDDKANEDIKKVLLLAVLAYQLKNPEVFKQLLIEVSEINKDEIQDKDVNKVKELLRRRREENEEVKNTSYVELGDVLEELYGEVTDGIEVVVEDEVYKILIKLLKGSIGEVANVNRKDIPETVRETFHKMHELIMSKNSGDVKLEIVEEGQIYRYKKIVEDTPHNFFLIRIWKDSYFNINIYTECMPTIISKITESECYKEIDNIEQAKLEANKRLCYYKPNDKQICIANITDDVSPEELEKLYEMCKDCMTKERKSTS